MLRVMLTISIFFTILVSDTINTKLGTPISNTDKKIKRLKDTKIKKSKKFRKDDHRYDKRYRDFDYDRYGYYNDDGFYFGFFDRRGYFFNNIYFEYNAQYTYNDRLYRRGYFAPYRHHYRRYRYHRDNDWNRVHCYREPNIVVYGNYYESPPTRYYQDRGYIRDYHENRRDHYYPNSRYNYRREPTEHHRSYHRDRGRVINHRFSDTETHRGNSSRTFGHIRDKKSKSNGRLQITK